MSKKKILTGVVHRLVDGVLESYGPGDPAPDWVTNPDVLADAETSAPAAATPASPAPPAPAPTGDGDDDGLDALKGDELKKIAEELGLAKSGSKPDLVARIRAKRAEESEDENDDDRDSLVEQAKALGIEVDENQSEVELQALIDAAKE